MITAVDTNILLDVLIPNAPHAASTMRALLSLGAEGELAVCEATYAELGRYFESEGELEVFLEAIGVNFLRTHEAALFAAGRAWLSYTRRRNSDLQCANCGTYQRVACRNCGTTVSSRQHVLADFLIGAHATAHADRLLTRDRGYYATYFPELRLA